MKVEFRDTFLPPDIPDCLIGIPSRGRWLTPSSESGKKYGLTDTLNSVHKALTAEGISQDAWVVVSDATDPDGLEHIHAQASHHLDLPENHARTFVMTRKTRGTLVEQVSEETGLERDVVEAMVDGIGYGDNRETLDLAIAALSTKGAVRFATLDDDVALPEYPLGWRQEVLDQQGITPLPNSQVVFAFNGHNRDELLEPLHKNGIRAFFHPLGKTVSELRREHPNMPVVESALDTRSEAFTRAQQGKMAQFVLSAGPEELFESEKAVIVGTTEDKSGLPDYPTWIISLSMLRGEFPTEEPVEAYPSGPRQLYAAQGSKTIFPDSALFGRIFDASSSANPALWPWWHVTSESISKQTGIAESSLRSDNDFLPKWLKYIEEKTGKRYLYASGLPTYAQHTRTPYGGDRRSPTEAAISSQVGNIAAVETFKRFEFSPEGVIYMHPIESDYQTPEEHAEIVYDRMTRLATECSNKILKLHEQARRTNDVDLYERNKKLTERYHHELTGLTRKMSGFNYERWKERLDTATRKQLVFSREQVMGKPRVIESLAKRISKGKYPVVEIIAQ